MESMLLPAAVHDFGDDGWFWTFTTAGSAISSQLSSPPHRGRRHGPAGPAVQTVHHRTNHTNWATPPSYARQDAL
jgi:hypothetical protein